jgi:HSP20 family protein
MADTVVTARTTEFDRTLDDHFLPSNAPKSGWDLTIDIYEQRGNVIAKMILPGINAANIDVSLDEDTLRISGQRQEENETKDKYNIQKIVHTRSFSRVVNLPKIVDPSKSSAQYKDDVLQVTMPAYTYTKAAAVKVNIGR